MRNAGLVVLSAALALALAGCGGLDPAVYRSEGQPPAAPAAARPARVAPAPPPPSAAEPRGRWSDDGLRYEEHESSTGVPFLPWRIGRTRGGR